MATKRRRPSPNAEGIEARNAEMNDVRAVKKVLDADPLLAKIARRAATMMSMEAIASAREKNGGKPLDLKAYSAKVEAYQRAVVDQIADALAARGYPIPPARRRLLAFKLSWAPDLFLS